MHTPQQNSRVIVATTTVFTWAALVLCAAEVRAQEVEREDAPSACPAQDQDLPEDALGLVVELKTYVDGSFRSNGSGIIIGDTSDFIYVATAAHVAFDAGDPVEVQASFLPHCEDPRPIAAQICSHNPAPGELDVALLCVPRTTITEQGETVSVDVQPAYSRRGAPARLGSSAPVRAVGCPAGECWDVSQPDQVLRVGGDPPTILFSTFFVAAGHSGGALFNRWGEVVGLVTAHGQPLSAAVPIDAVIDQLCLQGGNAPTEASEATRDAATQPLQSASMGCSGETVRLKEPFVPRAGYRFSIGFAPLFPNTGEPYPNDRFFSYRATVKYEVLPWLDVHAGALRLRPEDLSITGGVFGFDLKYRRGRFSAGAFLEGGMAHAEGRFDAGGYFVDDNGVNRYVPFWNQVEDDGLGFGAGVVLQLTGVIWNRAIVELTGGHWGFNKPDSAPDLPDIFFGGGLRIGF